MPFKLPEEMPTGTEDLAALRAEAQTELDAVRAAVRDGSVLSDEELADLRVLAESITALDSALAVSEAADAARQEEIDALLGGDEGEEDESTDEAH
jgi:hypothetical protein